MRIRIIILTIFLSGSLIAQKKLPVPTKVFIEKVKFEDDSEEQYFSEYLGEKSEKVLSKLDDTNEVCEKVCQYETGIILNRSCSESGSTVVIIFPDYSKDEIIKFVEWFFKTDYNTWDKLKNKYQPKEDGEAGCYLEIQELKNKIILNSYCGC